MQVHIQNDGPVTIELMSPSGPPDPKMVREKYHMNKLAEQKANCALFRMWTFICQLKCFYHTFCRSAAMHLE